MTPADYKYIIKYIDLTQASEMEFARDYMYYWFDLLDSSYRGSKDWICVITYQGKKAGVFHVCDNDIVIQVLEEYKSMGIMSTFLKKSSWKSRSEQCIEGGITISSVTLEGIDDFDMKVHLIKDLMKIKCRNADDIIKNHVLIDLVDDDDIYKQRYKYIGDGELHYYKEILEVMGVS